jgi:hypothetical protein
MAFDPAIDYSRFFQDILRQNSSLMTKFDEQASERNTLLNQVQTCQSAFSSFESGKAFRKAGGKQRTNFTGSPGSYDPKVRYPSGRKRHVRRCANEITKELACPYGRCSKTYGCDGSLNLHIKVKHHGGTKT